MTHPHVWPGNRPQGHQTVSTPDPAFARERNLRSASPALPPVRWWSVVAGGTTCRLTLPPTYAAKAFHHSPGLGTHEHCSTRVMAQVGAGRVKRGYLGTRPSVLLLKPVDGLGKAGIHALGEVGVGIAEVLTDPFCRALIAQIMMSVQGQKDNPGMYDYGARRHASRYWRCSLAWSGSRLPGGDPSQGGACRRQSAFSRRQA